MPAGRFGFAPHPGSREVTAATHGARGGPLSQAGAQIYQPVQADGAGNPPTQSRYRGGALPSDALSDHRGRGIHSTTFRATVNTNPGRRRLISILANAEVSIQLNTAKALPSGRISFHYPPAWLHSQLPGRGNPWRSGPQGATGISSVATP